MRSLVNSRLDAGGRLGHVVAGRAGLYGHQVRPGEHAVHSVVRQTPDRLVYRRRVHVGEIGQVVHALLTLPRQHVLR